MFVLAAGLCASATALPTANAQAIPLGVLGVLGTPHEAMRHLVIEETLAEWGTSARAARGRPEPETDPTLERRDALVELGEVLSAVCYRFLSGVTPGPDGVERPNPAERTLDEFEVPLGDTPLSYVLHGVGNYRYLSLSHYYQQYDGVHSLRLNFVLDDDPSPFRLSISGSPLHGSISIVNRHMGVAEDEDLPDQVIYGGAAGVNASYGSGPLRVHLSAYLLPEVELSSTGATGVAQFQTLELIVDLNRAVGWPRNEALEASVELLHMDRGDARRPLYDYGDGSNRGVRDVREIWQSMLHLTIRHE